MNYCPYRSDRAYVAARPVLRKKLGFARADDIEQCYQFLRLEYRTVDKLREQLDFELTIAEIAIIQARQDELQRQDESTVRNALQNWGDTPKPRECRQQPIGHSACRRPSTPAEHSASVSNLNAHEDVVRAYIRTIHSLTASLIPGSRLVARLLHELEIEALLAFKQLDELRIQVSTALTEVGQHSHTIGSDKDLLPRFHHHGVSNEESSHCSAKTSHDVSKVSCLALPIDAVASSDITSQTHSFRIQDPQNDYDQLVQDEPSIEDSDPEFVFV